MTIGRLIFRAKPAKSHPWLKEWETADIVIFVQAESKAEAVCRAKARLSKEHWEPVDIQICDRIMHEAVVSAGGDFLSLYEEADKRGAALRIFPRQWPRSKNDELPIAPLNLSETFFDRVVERAGGFRLVEDGKIRTADYRIGNWIFELKELQKEGLLEESRQQKIWAILKDYLDDEKPFRLDLKFLSEEERSKLKDILGTPIQKQVKSAAKQIRSTIDALGEDNLKGGLIYVNTGYNTIGFDDFGPMVERYVSKDTSQIDAFFCASVITATNGFDSQIMHMTYPDPGDNDVIEALRAAFETEFQEMVDSMLRGEIPSDMGSQMPLAPVIFSVNENMIVWDPGEVKATWKE